MKLDLWYNPVIPAMDVQIDGDWQDERDIYGFLYPVRSYPLQTWLHPNGSWNGLERQVLDFARGEPVTLVFHGRRIDYDDVAALLASADGVRLQWADWDPLRESARRFREVRDMMAAMKLAQAGWVEAEAQLKKRLNQGARDEPWQIEINTSDDLRRAQRSRGGAPVCVVSAGLLGTYAELHRLSALTNSLRYPADAIVCLQPTESQRDALAKYIGQFRQDGYRFATEAEWGGERSALRAALYEKYAKPHALRAERARLLEACAALDELRKEIDETNETRRQLIPKRATLSREQAARLAAANARHAWFAQEYPARIRQALSLGAPAMGGDPA